MIQYTDIFTDLGAFAHADAGLDALAHFDIEVSEYTDTLLSIPALAGLFESLNFDLGSAAIARDAGNALAWGVPMLKGLRENLHAQCLRWLNEVGKDQLGSTGDPKSILASLSRAMLADDESIEASSLSVSDPAADENNLGDALCFVSARTIAEDGSSHDSQLLRNATITLAATRDALSGGVVSGDERWQALSTAGASATLRTTPQTSGASESPRNAVIDGSFADWEAGEPEHWSLSGATPNVSEESTTKRFGDSALRIDGSGELFVTQDLAGRGTPIVGGQTYVLALNVYLDAHTAGTLTASMVLNSSAIEFDIVVDDNLALDSWHTLGVAIPLPRLAADDLLEIELHCDSSWDGDVVIDGVSFAAMSEIGDGLKAAIIQGPSDAARGDRFTTSTTNDDASPFGKFLRDRFDVELPTDASPTIDSALAE